jgi:prolyl 4-hydroxylase
MFLKKKFKNLLNRDVIIVRDFFNKSEIDFIYSKLKIKKFQPAKQKVFGRNNKEVLFYDFDIGVIIKYNILKLLLNKKFEKILVCDLLEFYKYDVGDFITPHLDSEIQIDDFHKSNYTAIVYLNDDFKGGNTFFKSKRISVKPKKGMLLLFKQNLIHESNIIIKGQKLIYRSNWYIV